MSIILCLKIMQNTFNTPLTETTNKTTIKLSDIEKPWMMIMNFSGVLQGFNLDTCF